MIYLDLLQCALELVDRVVYLFDLLLLSGIHLLQFIELACKVGDLSLFFVQIVLGLHERLL